MIARMISARGRRTLVPRSVVGALVAPGCGIGWQAQASESRPRDDRPCTSPASSRWSRCPRYVVEPPDELEIRSGRRPPMEPDQHVTVQPDGVIDLGFTATSTSPA